MNNLLTDACWTYNYFTIWGCLQVLKIILKIETNLYSYYTAKKLNFLFNPYILISSMNVDSIIINLRPSKLNNSKNTL